MTLHMLDDFDQIRNRRYLEQHKNDHPFPLNGSLWARLVNERLERERHPCLCTKCFNFLTYLHSKDSPLKRQRSKLQFALHHWFLQGNSTYNRHLDSIEEFRSDETPTPESKEIDIEKSFLEGAELKWLKSNVKASNINLVEGIKSTQACDSPENINNPILEAKTQNEKRARASASKYWDECSNEYYESRQISTEKQSKLKNQENLENSLAGNKFEEKD